VLRNKTDTALWCILLASVVTRKLDSFIYLKAAGNFSYRFLFLVCVIHTICFTYNGLQKIKGNIYHIYECDCDERCLIFDSMFIQLQKLLANALCVVLLTT